MPIWAAKLHIMYADLSNVLFVNLMNTIKMMMMMMMKQPEKCKSAQTFEKLLK